MLSVGLEIIFQFVLRKTLTKKGVVLKSIMRFVSEILIILIETH